MTGIDYIQTRETGIVHISEWYSNTALCGTALIGHIRAVAKPKAVCPECQGAGGRLLTALGFGQEWDGRCAAADTHPGVSCTYRDGRCVS